MEITLIKSYEIDNNFLRRRRFAKYILSSFYITLFAASRNSYADNINSNYTGPDSYGPLIIHPTPPRPHPRQAEIDRLNVNIKHLLADVYMDNLVLDKTELQSNEPVSGKFTLINDSPVKKNGELKLSLMNEFDIDDISTEKSEISLDSNAVHEVFFKNGPKLSAVNDNINARFLAQSKLSDLESKLTILNA